MAISDRGQLIEFNQINSTLSIENKSSKLIYLSFSLNGEKLITNSEELLYDIQAVNDDEKLGFPYQAWKYIKKNNYHFDPITRDIWLHNPFIYLNSIGNGYCDDVAAVFASIMRMKGLKARVWALNGHVVPEVFYNGKWMVFDPDLEVFYLNEESKVASVDELAQNGELITNPKIRLPVENSTAYSPFLSEIYGSVSDNEVATYYDKVQELTRYDLPLPSGSYTLMQDASGQFFSINNTYYPKLTKINLKVEAGWSGELNVPLKLVEIEGKGTIQYNKESFTIEEFKSVLKNELNLNFNSGLNVLRSDGISLNYLINPERFKFNKGYNKLEIHSDDARKLNVRIK